MWLCALVCPVVARAADQYARYNGACTQGGQRVVTNGTESRNFFERSFPRCTVTVYLHGTLNKATIFSDSAGTLSLLNPFQAAQTGDASWYAPDARYDVQYSGGQAPFNTITTPFSVSDILLCFACTGGGGGGGSSNATQLQGIGIATTAPLPGQFLGFNGVQWGPTAITGFLALTGGTLTGPLTLFGNPVGVNDAANKGYVDTRLLSKADLLLGVVPTGELGSGAADITKCLAGNSTWQPCGGSFSFPVAAPDSSAPQYSFLTHANVGLNTILSVPVQVISVQVAGSAGNQTITLTLATPLRPLSWGQNDTFQLANLPSSPTNLTLLNGVTFTIPLNGVTGSTPTSTVTFIAATSIGVSTYTVATGTASIWDGYLQGHSYTFNRFDSSTLTGGLNIIGEHGSIRFARRDAVVSRAGGIGLTGIDNALIRGSQQFDPVNAVGAGAMSVNGAHSLGATTLSITKGAGANWLAKAGDVIEIGKANGDAEKQDYIVASDTTVVQGSSTSVPIISVLPGTGLATALSGGELISASRIQAQVGDASGIEVLGPATFLTDVNIYGNINQLGTGAWLTSGTKQSAVTVTVPQGKDFSLFVGSDNIFHCQLSTLLGGGSCGGGGGGGGVTSVGFAAPAAFSVTGSPVTGASTITLGYGSGQIPVANLATGTPTGLKFIRDDGTLVAPLTFSSTPVSTLAVASPVTSSLVGNALTIGCTTCLPLSGALVSGDLLSNNGTSATDAAVVAANVVTSASNFTSGNIPKAAGANKALTNGYGVQGTDTNLLTSGTISGVASSLCTDAQGGATTVGCSSGTSVVQISGTPTVNQVAVWTNATTIQGLTATGTLGSPVFSVSPTLVTPNIGVATATTINKVTITAPASASTLTIANSKTFTASNTITLTGTDGVSLNVSLVPTAAANYVFGNLISAAASDRTTVDSGVVAANVVTATANFVNAHVPIAGGANKTLIDGFATQGTDTSLLTSGTISGTLGALLCLDAQSGATTAGCVGGGSGNTTSTTLTTNTLPKANGANSIIDSLLSDNGTTLIYGGTGGIQTGTSGTGQWLALEGAGPSGLAANDLIYASDATGPCSGGHGWAIKNNNGSADCLASANNVIVWNNKLFDTALAGNILRINGLSITGTSGNTPTVANASGVFTNGNLTMTDAGHNVVDASIVAANVPTASANFVAGNLVQGAAANKTLSDSGVVAANVVTAAAAFVSGHIPKAAGANRILADGYGVQGTDTNLITSGTIAGTSVLVCTDANGGITTAACPSPSATAGGSNTQLQYNNATALGGISQWTTNGTTTVTGSSTSVFDISAASVTAGFKMPIAAGAVPTADGFQAVNTTTHAHVWGSNGTTIVGAAAATGTNTNTVCAASNWVSTISGIAAPSCTQPSVSDLSTGALVNGATATTQATFSNDTKVATDAYADRAVKPIYSTAATAISMVTAGTNTVLTGPTTMVTPGADGTYRLVFQVTQTTAGSGGTCTVGGAGISVGFKDADTAVTYSIGVVDLIPFTTLSGTAVLNAVTMTSAANGAGNNYTTTPREFRAAASTAITYQVFQLTNSNCTTPPVFTVRPALYYMGY